MKHTDQRWAFCYAVTPISGQKKLWFSGMCVVSRFTLEKGQDPSSAIFFISGLIKPERICGLKDFLHQQPWRGSLVLGLAV